MEEEKRGGLYRQLWFWVLIAIALGIAFGFLFEDAASKSQWLADAFISLVKTITGPVIFLTVVIGIASLGDLSKAGGLVAKALGYFLIATIIALTLGLTAANLVGPGEGFDAKPTESSREQAKEQIKEAGSTDTGIVTFITDDLVPTSVVEPFVENEILRILVLAILFAAAISALETKKRQRVLAGFETAAEIVFKIVRIIMWAAPIGAFGGIAFTIAEFGGETLTNLAKLMVTFWVVCAIFVFVVLGAAARFLGGFNIFKLIRLIKDELLIILGTSSSETVLPRLLNKLEGAGAKKSTVGVVLPTGYSFNLDGTCIYLTLGALFIVQATGQDMAIGEQIALAGLMVLTSKGAAGITGAGLITLTASLQAFGGQFFSVESIAVGIALVVGIDRVMSEGRAVTNCIGNSVATLIVARWQGDLDQERLHQVLDDPSVLAGTGREREEAGSASDVLVVAGA